MIIAKDNFNEAYAELCSAVEKGAEINVRGLATKELLHVSLMYKPETAVLDLLEKDQYKYMAKEMLTYVSGTRNADDFIRLSSFWEKVAEDKKINSNYGYFVFHQETPSTMSQFEWCVEELRNDKMSRKCVINYNNISHKNDIKKDFPCTIFQSFIIRGGALHSFVVMRSNDIDYGLRYDAVWFSFVHMLMHAFVKHGYPTLELGTMHHTALSMHKYIKNGK